MFRTYSTKYSVTACSSQRYSCEAWAIFLASLPLVIWQRATSMSSRKLRSWRAVMYIKNLSRIYVDEEPPCPSPQRAVVYVLSVVCEKICIICTNVEVIFQSHIQDRQSCLYLTLHYCGSYTIAYANSPWYHLPWALKIVRARREDNAIWMYSTM